MYEVTINSHAERELRKLDRQIKNRIVTAILALAAEPRPAGCLKVKGENNLWRIRISDWRVGYEIDDGALEITIVRIGHRSEFYD
jgi:mRNA interferase RelE/StbE